MINSTNNEKTVGITGASGALGKELTKLFRKKGYKVIGFTHRRTNYETNLESPNEWIKWKCGKESSLKKTIRKDRYFNFEPWYLRFEQRKFKLRKLDRNKCIKQIQIFKFI